MNNSRRKRLAKAIEQLNEIYEEVSCIRDEEQEAFDNIPENLEGSDRYNSAEEALDNLEGAVDQIEEFISMIEEAINQ